MDKRTLHHYLTQLRTIKVWYLLVVLAISLVVFVGAMRGNNLTMVQLRNDVYAADKNNTDIERALQRLRSFVHGHMNTKLEGNEAGVYPPIQLQHTFQRLKEAEQKRVEQTNAQVYTDAQAHCERLYPGSFSGGPRIPCIEEFVSTHGVKAQAIPSALYKFDFASPVWSPDLAGFSALVSLLLGIAIALRLAAGFILARLVD